MSPQSPSGALLEVDYGREARSIEAAFDVHNRWSAMLRKHVTRADVTNVKKLAALINPTQSDEIVVRFFSAAMETLRTQPKSVTRTIRSLPRDWYSDSIYYVYAQYFGTKDGYDAATFDDLVRGLDHLDYLGVKNILILPHYESPGGDGGYDVSSFEASERLGGEAAYARFMKAAVARGFRVITDIPANHTSTEHRWFQALLSGDREKFGYYVNMDGAEKLGGGPIEMGGRPRSLIRHKDGSISPIWQMFPHASDENWIEVEIQGERHKFFHTFYPFQVDLNLQNPRVLEELFRLLGREANYGNVGKRMDAAPYWFKRPGTDFEGLPETHALQALFKTFIRLVVSGKGITIPEAGFSIHEAAKYFGAPIEIGGLSTSSEGDAVFAFEMQAALREMIFTASVDPFWRAYESLPELPRGAVWFNMLGHHDEIRTDLMSEGARDRVRALLIDRGAMDFAGRGLGGRTADLLERSPERIANAYFLLFMAPGTPIVYYGDEIGAVSDPEHMAKEQKKRFRILGALGVPVTMASALDTRDLNRGPIPASAFARARASGYLPAETIRALNALRRARPSLKSSTLERLATKGGSGNVLSLVRSADRDRPIIALSNLTGEPVSVSIPIASLESKIGSLEGTSALRDLLGTTISGRPRDVAFRREGGEIVIELGPHEHVLLDHLPTRALSGEPRSVRSRAS